MRSGRIGRVVRVVGLTTLSARAGAGQSAYMAGGIGPTPVIEARLHLGGILGRTCTIERELGGVERLTNLSLQRPVTSRAFAYSRGGA